jgi:hypothetical protein
MEKSAYDYIYKLVFIMDQYGWKSELHNSFWCKSVLSNFNICEMVCGIMEKSIYGIM